MTDRELKPCPFCNASDGSEVYVERLQSDARRWAVLCTATDCLVEGPHRATKREAIKAWNTRAALRPEAQGVKVRKLEWDANHASTEIGLYAHYTGFPHSDGDTVVQLNETIIGHAHGPQDAKAAAQADFDARILSALDRPEAQDGVASAAKVLLCDREAMSAMCSAAAVSRAKDDEGEFEPLHDLIGFSGENKTRMVIFAAIYAALRALSQGGK